MVHIPGVNVKSGLDEMIDVWTVHEPGYPRNGCVFDVEADAEAFAHAEASGEAPLVVTPKKMTRKDFEALGEFNGF